MTTSTEQRAAIRAALDAATDEVESAGHACDAARDEAESAGHAYDTARAELRRYDLELQSAIGTPGVDDAVSRYADALTAHRRAKEECRRDARLARRRHRTFETACARAESKAAELDEFDRRLDARDDEFMQTVGRTLPAEHHFRGVHPDRAMAGERGVPS